FARGGLLHFGQGKWYPGEPLPRWQYSLLWRKDGVPLWRGAAPAALANGAAPRRQHEPARGFMLAFCEVMGLPITGIQPAFEDPFLHLHQEAQLPIDYVPDANHKDLAQRTLAQVLGRGLDT